MFHGYISAVLTLSGALAGGGSAAPPSSLPAVAVPHQLPRQVRTGTTQPHRLEARLAQRISCSFRNVPVRGALDDLRTISGLNFVVDGDALKEAGVDADQRISLEVQDVAMRAILDLLLRQAHLAYVVKDEHLLVTTPQEARGKLRTVTYAVADLVVPVAVLANNGEEKPSVEKSLEQRLMTLITKTIAPDSWAENGGEGGLQYFPLGMALVVNQTQDVHEQIQDLLCALRRLQDLEVAVEVRLIQASDSTLKKVLVQKKNEWSGYRVGSIVDDRQLASLLTRLGSDRRTRILQAPKVTVFNGQSVPVDLTQTRLGMTELVPAGGTEASFQKEMLATGWKYRICPVVSADRRTVRLKLSLKHTDVEDLAPLANTDAAGRQSSTAEIRLARSESLSLEQSLAIPDGKTAVLYVGERVSRSGQKHRRDSIQHFLVLVTPRIIVNQEEQARPPVTSGR